MCSFLKKIFVTSKLLSEKTKKKKKIYIYIYINEKSLHILEMYGLKKKKLILCII